MLWPLVSRVVRAPGRVAVVDDLRKYTYAQLLGGAMFLAERIDATTSARHVGKEPAQMTPHVEQHKGQGQQHPGRHSRTPFDQALLHADLSPAKG